MTCNGYYALAVETGQRDYPFREIVSMAHGTWQSWFTVRPGTLACWSVRHNLTEEEAIAWLIARPGYDGLLG